MESQLTHVEYSMSTSPPPTRLPRPDGSVLRPPVSRVPRPGSVTLDGTGTRTSNGDRPVSPGDTGPGSDGGDPDG